MASERHRLREVARERARPVGRFPAAQRIKTRRDFQRAQSQGRRVVTAHCVLLLHARETEPSDRAPTSGAVVRAAPARLGITASRKLGNAPVRNRAKRLVREAFRATRDLWPPGVDLVVIVRRPLQGMKLDDLVTEWRQVSGLVRRRAEQAQHEALERAEATP